MVFWLKGFLRESLLRTRPVYRTVVTQIQETQSSGQSDAAFVHNAAEDMGSGAESKVVSANGATDAQTMLGRVQEAVRGIMKNTGKGQEEDLPACPLTIDENSSRCDTPLHAVYHYSFVSHAWTAISKYPTNIH